MPMAVRVGPGMGCGSSFIPLDGLNHFLDLHLTGPAIHDDSIGVSPKSDESLVTS
jgi:hypothetical protein